MKIYYIAMNMWVSESGVPRRTEGAALGAHNGKLYLIGGVAGPTYQASNQIDVYDIARRIWLPSVDAKMPAATAYAGVAQYGNALFIVGGMSSIYQPVFLVQRYDMGSHTWQTADYPTGMVFPGLVVTSKYLYVLGGDPAGDQAWTASELVERLALSDWQAGAWELVDYHLRKPVLGVSGYCTEVLFGGEVWEVGGSDGGVGLVYTNTYYRPAEECWIDPAR